MARSAEQHDVLWKKRISDGTTLNPSNASAWKLASRMENIHSILDAGCGDGLFLNLFPPAIKKTGVDFSRVAVDAAKKKKIDAMQTNLDDQLPFKDDSFDLVCSIQTLQHVNDPLFCMRELARVSKKNVLINVPNHLYFHFRLNYLLGSFPQVLASVPNHKQVFSLSKMETFIAQSGLTILERDSTGGSLAPTHPSLFATGFTFWCQK